MNNEDWIGAHEMNVTIRKGEVYSKDKNMEPKNYQTNMDEWHALYFVKKETINKSPCTLNNLIRGIKSMERGK